MLRGIKKLVDSCVREECDDNGTNKTEKSFWKNGVAPHQLLVPSLPAIGVPATAAVLAKSFKWQSLWTPSLLFDNVGYVLAAYVV